MKRIVQLLILSALVFVSAPAFPHTNDSRSAEPFKGDPLHLQFVFLEPGHRYVLEIRPVSSEKGLGFTGSVAGTTPDHFEVTPGRLDFLAPPHPDPGSKYVKVSFTVGLAVKRGMEIFGDLEEPASVHMSLEDINVSGAGGAIHGKGSVKFERGGTPYGCFEFPTCSYTRQETCTDVNPRYKCYGPVIGVFNCCTSDPYPPAAR